MEFLTSDFIFGLTGGLTAWLLGMGSNAVWRTFQKIVTPDNTSLEV